MKMILNLILIFLYISLFASYKNVILNLPRELFFKIIEEIIPHVLSPTHPEEIMTIDYRMLAYKAVCKKWKYLLDQNINFRDAESLFVSTYFWPANNFVKLYNLRFKQGWYHPDKAFKEDEQKQIVDYKKACQAIDRLSMFCHSNDCCTTLVQSYSCFFGPFYDLLLKGQISLWYNLFKEALAYHDSKYHREISIIFARQYLRYCKASGSNVQLLEESRVFESLRKIIELTSKSLKHVPEDAPFYYENYNKSSLLEFTSETICMLHTYIQQGGFLSYDIYHNLQILFLSQEQVIKDLLCNNDTIVKEIKNACDFNMLLPHILIDYIQNEKVLYELVQKKEDPKINYLTLLNNFYQLSSTKQIYCPTIEKKLATFFQIYQSYFIQEDVRKRLFVETLFLATFNQFFVLRLLSSFIQGVDQNHILFSKDKKAEYKKIFEKKFAFFVDNPESARTHLSAKEVDVLKSYFNILPITINDSDSDKQITQSDVSMRFVFSGIGCSFAGGITLGLLYLINSFAQAGHPFVGNATLV